MAIAKPTGWKGKTGDRYWHKDTAHGVRSKCTDCGRDVLGWAYDVDRRFHYDTCSRVAGPRKEWKGYVDATGTVCVHRLTVEREGQYETREAALLALDEELKTQAATIARQRDDLARMLAKPEGA